MARASWRLDARRAAWALARALGAPDDVASRAADAVGETGDPGQAYFILSNLYRMYYGGDVRYPRVDEYYKRPDGPIVGLPDPPASSGVDTLEALRRRRSRRRYGRTLGLNDVSAILYYTVGVTGRAWWGGPKRVYPSAGALQPVEAYLAASRVDGLEPGVYHYNPEGHHLTVLRRGDYSGELASACLDQEHVAEAPAAVILTITVARTASKYGFRGVRYALMDVGFAGENLYLAAEALGLATVAVGAFYDEEICWLVGADCLSELPALVFPVGPRGGGRGRG